MSRSRLSKRAARAFTEGLGGPTVTLPAAPYRSLAIVDERRPARVEAAHCGWCRFNRHYGLACGHPVQGHPTHDVWCKTANPRGECGYWESTWWTRGCRRLRLGRAPVMVDPRVWDE